MLIVTHGERMALSTLVVQLVCFSMDRKFRQSWAQAEKACGRVRQFSYKFNFLLYVEQILEEAYIIDEMHFREVLL